MQSFERIYRRASKRKGGDDELEALLTTPKSARSLARIKDHRWLARMTRHVFSAGFVWSVIENKWEGFEEVFEDFDPETIAVKSDRELDEMAKDERIVRNRQKVWATRDNARMIVDAALDHGSFAKMVARWPADDLVGLLQYLQKNGGRLGGRTGQYTLRMMGVDTFILTRDVVAALIKAKVITKAPTSKKAMATVQAAFNEWREQSGRSLTEISRVLACSIDA